MKKSYDREAVGRRIKEKRTILGLTQEELDKEKPDVVLVHGDTSTTFVTALLP